MNRKLAVIVPVRDREEHVKQFIPHMLNHLSFYDFDIYFIEMEQGPVFNKGLICNVGYLLAKDKCDYVVFNDVDMLPIQCEYGYSPNVQHLASQCEQYGWSIPFPAYFGGAVQLPKEHFEAINGFSNQYERWGKEDDDMFMRLRAKKIPTDRRIGRFKNLKHKPHAYKDDGTLHQEVLNNDAIFASKTMQNVCDEGLNNCWGKVLTESHISNLHHYLVSVGVKEKGEK